MDKVSVIIPTYNRSKLVKRAILSVLRQTFKNFEIIVIDDGSADDTEVLIKRINDPRIIYRRIQHSGVSRARNEGIKHSNGNWIAFLDSDDEWVNTKLQKQMQYLKNNPQFSVCHTDEIWIKNGTRINQSKKHRKYSGDFFVPSLKMCLISPSSVLIRRDILDHIGGFDEDFEYVEDYELWLRLTSKYKIGYIDEKLVIKYGGHSDQLSKRIDGIEKYRMLALEKFIINNYSDGSMKSYVAEAFSEYSRKAEIYSLGCIKRGKISELDELRKRFVQIESLLKGADNLSEISVNKKLNLKIKFA